jgi:hypothetical protein
MHEHVVRWPIGIPFRHFVMYINGMSWNEGAWYFTLCALCLHSLVSLQHDFLKMAQWC